MPWDWMTHPVGPDDCGLGPDDFLAIRQVRIG